jgi:1-acyl-sn-glycerol-3-phosphate acyltransferase
MTQSSVFYHNKSMTATNDQKILISDSNIKRNLIEMNNYKSSNAFALNSFFAISPRIIQFFVITFARIYFKLFFKYKIYGLNNLDHVSGNAIFAANHTSEWDPIIVTMGIFNHPQFKPLFYVSREKRFYENSGWRRLFYGGLIFRMCGAYPVITGVRNYGVSLNTHINLLINSRSICIFPEGKKSTGNLFREAKGGAGYLIYKTKKPVIPVAISGVANLNLKSILLRRRNLTITFGQPMSSEDLFMSKPSEDFNHQTDPYKTASEQVMNKIRSLLS